jgi:hypothetical protein
MLNELRGDLGQQAVPYAWAREVDIDGVGPATIRNRLVEAATTEWVAFVDDDDRIYPNHLSTLLDNSADQDVVYTFCDVEGRSWEPNHDCHMEVLEAANTIPVTALVRRSAFLEVGGFPLGVRDEDWGLWLAMKHAGARFRCVHETTWLYRFHQVGRGNRTWWPDNG